MKEFLKYLLCAFWGCDTEYLSWTVIKGEKVETNNIYPTCKRCGALTGEPCGVTHLGPFVFSDSGS